jgi:hypothetical protein
MGFVPLADKVIYKRRGILRDLDALLRAVLKTPRDSRNVPLGEGRISFGRFGDILVSPEPLPERMAEIVSRSSTPAAKIAPFQDENFFRWRYGNPVGKYAFYIHEDRGAGAGYVVVAVSPDGRAGDIVDFGEEREGPIAAILDHISSAGEFEQLEILSYSVDARLWDTLRRSGFKRWRGRLVNRVRGTWPLLVRPVRPDCSEEDWFLGGLDIRDARNWILKEICADSA